MRELVHQMNDVAVWIIAVLGAVTAVGAALRWVVKRIRRLVAWAEKQAERLERVDELAKELRPNGGRSIKDVTDETAAKMAGIDDAVAAIKVSTTDLSDKFAIHLVQAAAVTDETAAKTAAIEDAVAAIKVAATDLSDKFAIHLVQAAARDTRLTSLEEAVIFLCEGRSPIERDASDESTGP